MSLAWVLKKSWRWIMVISLVALSMAAIFFINQILHLEGKDLTSICVKLLEQLRTFLDKWATTLDFFYNRRTWKTGSSNNQSILEISLWNKQTKTRNLQKKNHKEQSEKQSNSKHFFPITILNNFKIEKYQQLLMSQDETMCCLFTQRLRVPIKQCASV